MSISTLDSRATVQALDDYYAEQDDMAATVRMLRAELMAALQAGELNRMVGPIHVTGSRMTALEALEYGVGWEGGPTLAEVLQLALAQAQGIDMTVQLRELVGRIAQQWADQMAAVG